MDWVKCKVTLTALSTNNGAVHQLCVVSLVEESGDWMSVFQL